MFLGTVTGNCTSTVKDPSLEGRRLLLVRALTDGQTPGGTLEVATDELGAGVGSTVLLVRGSSTRNVRGSGSTASDLAVVAIVDAVHQQG